MKTRTKTYGDELEIVELYISKALTITVETFKDPSGYKSFARNSYLHHEDLLGLGVHTDKEESLQLAIMDLEDLMEEYNRSSLYA